MDYNSNLEKREESADNDLASKLALEALFIPKMKKLFADMSEIAHKLFVEENKVIKFNDWKPKVETVLKQHYETVQEKFSEKLRKAEEKLLKEKLNDTRIKNLNNTIDSELAIFARDQSFKSATEITETSNNHWEAFIIAATATLIDEGTKPEKATIARLAKEKFDIDSVNRADLIAVTETQNAAEGAKFIEAQTLIEKVEIAEFEEAILSVQNPQPNPVIAQPNQTELAPIPEKERTVTTAVKEWITVGDSRVRPTHQEANYQRVNVEDHFIVGGERLMFPRDDSLGATMKEIANCRCSAQYKLIEESR